jgi:UvrD/REP helicase N-terminal domain
MTARTPTPEQSAIIEAFLSGADLVIEAGAGTGKSSTLRMMAEASPRQRCLYVAYNKAIQTDAAAAFPRNVTCKTAHSIAYGSVGRQFARRLNGPRMPARRVAVALGINFPLSFGDRVIQPTQLARLVSDTVRRFCLSADTEIAPWHVPGVNGLDETADRDAIRDAVLPYARKAWRTDLTSRDGQLPYTHDCYLKAWSLSGPRLDYDVVMLDEAQDSSPVVAAVVSDQDSAQKCLVGDENQSIYQWRLAVNAMRDFGGKRLQLTKSFRFGQAIADEANKWLAVLDSPLRLTGYERLNSVVQAAENPDAILCRTNAKAIGQVMAGLGTGHRVALVGGGNDMRRLAEAAASLKAGLGTDHPELFAFRTWAEVQDYAENDSAGSDLKVLVRLVDQHGPDALIDAMDRLVPENRADVIVGTSHRAKGREWNAVRIADDFHEPKPQDDGSPGVIDTAEAMLAYVAVTRAQLTLDRAGLAWVDKYLPAGAR